MNEPSGATDRPDPDRLVGPAEGPTPVVTGGGGRKPRPYPPDLLREASRRLRVMTLLGATLWFAGTSTYHLVLRAMRPGDDRWLMFHTLDAIGLFCISISLLLYWYLRRDDRDPQRVLDLALGYQIAGAIGIGFAWHAEKAPPGWVLQPMITWVGPMLLITAAIIPNTPRRTLVAGLIAASMNPIGMYLSRAQGNWPFESFSDVMLMHYPDLFLVGVAVVISHVMMSLGQHVAKARELGAYRLGELLGRGGMGEVYLATHRMLARPAAIKLIRPEALGAENSAAAALAIRRFRREAEVAAGLRSPHTVELYDFGITEEDTLYIVMELLDGLTLEQLVRTKGRLPPNRVIHVLRQVCESLEEAHQRGLVHRDIKPANIHVGRLGLRHDFVKVLDFGLVKSVAKDPSNPSLETAAELMAGTPAFMAPEVALGEAYDGRSDLYALGCVAYYLLTAELVFEGDTPIHLIARHLHAKPVPPSDRIGVPLPNGLERLVLACLAKRPEDRPAGAGELARLLAAIPEPPWREEEARDWWERHGPPRAH